MRTWRRSALVVEALADEELEQLAHLPTHARLDVGEIALGELVPPRGVAGGGLLLGARRLEEAGEGVKEVAVGRERRVRDERVVPHPLAAMEEDVAGVEGAIQHTCHRQAAEQARLHELLSIPVGQIGAAERRVVTRPNVSFVHRARLEVQLDGIWR